MSPYEVLGVSENASDKEVRAAYLKLVKKYHPDRYQDNPLKNLADEKLKEINEAYDTINRERTQRGASGSGSGYNSGANYGSGAGSRSNPYGNGSRSYAEPGTGRSSYAGSYSAEFSRVRQCLSNQSLGEAAAILDRIPLRSAEWYFLYGIVYFRSGEYSQAYDYLEKAVQMEPDNTEYRQAFSALSSRGSRRYNSAYRSAPASSSCSVCDVCSSLMCADCCCECMGGDFIRCI